MGLSNISIHENNPDQRFRTSEEAPKEHTFEIHTQKMLIEKIQKLQQSIQILLVFNMCFSNLGLVCPSVL